MGLQVPSYIGSFGLDRARWILVTSSGLQVSSLSLQVKAVERGGQPHMIWGPGPHEKKEEKKREEKEKKEGEKRGKK